MFHQIKTAIGHQTTPNSTRSMNALFGCTLTLNVQTLALEADKICKKCGDIE